MTGSGEKDNDRPRLGISTCLLGENVRWDGGHQHDRFLTGTLGRFVDYVPVCPEVECGFPIPREPFHLEGDPQHPRLVTSRTNVDHTKRMERWAADRVAELEKEELCGFIFKSGSPSSGMERVKVRNEKGMPVKKGRGIFARVFMEKFPLLPVEDDGRLHDIHLRENFIERIFTLKRWREMVRDRKNMGGLVDFHTRHKMLIMAHHPEIYRKMGKLVAGEGPQPLPQRLERYQQLLMDALKYRATQRKNSNVLQHDLGGRGPLQAHFILFSTNRETVTASFNQERREMAAIDLGKDCKQVSEGRVGDELLDTVEQVMTTIIRKCRSGSGAQRVAATVRFGQAISCNPLTRGQFVEVFSFLLVGTIINQRQ